MAETREALESRLLFNEGGYGLGIGGTLTWTFSPATHDLSSIVAITGPASKYTDDELRTLADVSDALTAAYDELFTERRGANLWIVDKDDQFSPKRWMVKRLTWDHGYPRHATLKGMLDWLAEKK